MWVTELVGDFLVTKDYSENKGENKSAEDVVLSDIKNDFVEVDESAVESIDQSDKKSLVFTQSEDKTNVMISINSENHKVTPNIQSAVKKDSEEISDMDFELINENEEYYNQAKDHEQGCACSVCSCNEYVRSITKYDGKTGASLLRKYEVDSPSGLFTDIQNAFSILFSTNSIVANKLGIEYSLLDSINQAMVQYGVLQENADELFKYISVVTLLNSQMVWKQSCEHVYNGKIFQGEFFQHNNWRTKYLYMFRKLISTIQNKVGLAGGVSETDDLEALFMQYSHYHMYHNVRFTEDLHFYVQMVMHDDAAKVTTSKVHKLHVNKGIVFNNVGDCDIVVKFSVNIRSFIHNYTVQNSSRAHMWVSSLEKYLSEDKLSRIFASSQCFSTKIPSLNQCVASFVLHTHVTSEDMYLYPVINKDLGNKIPSLILEQELAEKKVLEEEKAKISAIKEKEAVSLIELSPVLDTKKIIVPVEEKKDTDLASVQSLLTPSTGQPKKAESVISTEIVKKKKKKKKKKNMAVDSANKEVNQTFYEVTDDEDVIEEVIKQGEDTVTEKVVVEEEVKAKDAEYDNYIIKNALNLKQYNKTTIVNAEKSVSVSIREIDSIVSDEKDNSISQQMLAKEVINSCLHSKKSLEDSVASNMTGVKAISLLPKQNTVGSKMIIKSCIKKICHNLDVKITEFLSSYGFTAHCYYTTMGAGCIEFTVNEHVLNKTMYDSQMEYGFYYTCTSLLSLSVLLDRHVLSLCKKEEVVNYVEQKLQDINLHEVVSKLGNTVEECNAVDTNLVIHHKLQLVIQTIPQKVVGNDSVSFFHDL